MAHDAEIEYLLNSYKSRLIQKYEEKINYKMDSLKEKLKKGNQYEEYKSKFPREKYILDPIYAQCGFKYQLVNRNKLNEYDEDIQRIMGGRNKPTSMYKGKSCYNLTEEQFKKVVYIKILDDGIDESKLVKRDFITEPWLLKFDCVNCDGIPRYKFPLLEFTLKYYPPMDHKILISNTYFAASYWVCYPKYDFNLFISNVDLVEFKKDCWDVNMHFDEKLKEKKGKYFPFSINEYYDNIYYFLRNLYAKDKSNEIHITTEDTLKKHPWIRNLDFLLHIDIEDCKKSLGNFKRIVLIDGIVDNVNVLQLDANDVKFKYADCCICACKRYEYDINCRFLIIGEVDKIKKPDEYEDEDKKSRLWDYEHITFNINGNVNAKAIFSPKDCFNAKVKTDVWYSIWGLKSIYLSKYYTEYKYKGIDSSIKEKYKTVKFVYSDNPHMAKMHYESRLSADLMAQIDSYEPL